MNSPDFNITFQHKGINYNISLVQGEKSDQTVQINGISYAILGHSEQLETACKILRSLSLDTVQTAEDLVDKLSLCDDISFASAHKTNSIATHTLSVSSISKYTDISKPENEEGKFGMWMTKELAILSQRQEQIAQRYWDMYISKDTQKNHSELINFLKNIPNGPDNLEDVFIKSIGTPKDFELFLSLFRHLSTDHLHSINGGEKLNAMPIVSLTNQPVNITSSFLQEMQDYMLDIHFSGVVFLSDENSVHMRTTDPLNAPNAPFAMHSVGKVFTGALMLTLIENEAIPEEALNKPIQLDEEIIKALPLAVSEQLSQTTLHEVMLHLGRYGDYLSNYQDAIEFALKEKSPIPQVIHPQDFLIYADKELIPLDKLTSEGDSYSNLGILLVGLSIEHLYNMKAEKKLSYSEILNEYVVNPAGMKTFKITMPKDARVNPEDPLAPHISGGPAGGYWCTASDLLQFGNWLGKKSKNKNFMRLLESYGGEFYTNREISHGGSIESASAHISHRIDNGLTIAVMSDMTGFGQASKLAQKIQEHLLGLN